MNESTRQGAALSFLVAILKLAPEAVKVAKAAAEEVGLWVGVLAEGGAATRGGGKPLGRVVMALLAPSPLLFKFSNVRAAVQACAPVPVCNLPACGARW